jgi:hypothetical protein
MRKSFNRKILLNAGLQCDFNVQSASEFNGFQPNSLRNGTSASSKTAPAQHQADIDDGDIERERQQTDIQRER